MKKYAILTALLSSAAVAAPPPDADRLLAPFYKSLTLPGYGQGYCCTTADCRPVDAEQRDGVWWALASKEVFGLDAPDKYLPIDPSHIIPEGTIPPNRRPLSPVGCFYNGEFRCFIPPPNSL